MVQLWFPKDELKADLEEQAKRRLEEITRAAAQRREEITTQAQSTLNDERLQSAMTRFNSLVDPLIQQGRDALDQVGTGVQDNAARAQQLVEEANRSLGMDGAMGSSPSLIPEPGQPSAFAPAPPTPPTPSPIPEPQTPPSLSPGFPGQPSTPEPPISPAPEIAAPPMPSPISPPGMGSPFGSPPGGPPSPPSFKPPGMQGVGDALGGIGEQVTQGRDQAMELASKSLDVAREAVSGGQQRAGQLGTWRDAQMQRPGRDVLADANRAATDVFAGFREQQAQARQAAATDTSQADWEARQGLQRSDADVSGGPVVRALEGLEGAARGWEKSRRMGEEQFRTAMGYGTAGEGLPEQLQAGFGAAMGPYGALPEMARGGVENLTGNPLAGAAAYGAASILGPGGPRAFLQEGLPLVPRILREGPRAVAQAEGLIPTARAASAGLGVAGAPVAGGVTGALALREGKTPQEAAAEGLTTAADVIQLAEMADLPIAAADRVLRALPNLPGAGRFLPPGLRPAPRPGLESEPGAPLPEERAPEERLPGDEGLDLDGALPGRTPEALAAAAAARARREADFGSDVDAANRSLLSPLAPGESPAAAQQRVGEEARAAGQMEEATGTLGERLRRALGAAGEELGPPGVDQSRLGLTFGNAPTVVPGPEGGRQRGAIEQTIGGERVAIPETAIDLAGRRAQAGFPVNPETRLLQGTIEDKLARAYRERDLTVEEEDALGLGVAGQTGPAGEKATVRGVNRLLGFRHPGWMAKEYTPDPEAGVMRYLVPDKKRMAVEHPTWKPHLRTGDKGAYHYEPIRTKRGETALDALEDAGDDVSATPGRGTKVLYDPATGEEINIATHPDMPWVEAQTPITVKEGMARDGSVEPQARTPLSYHRLALVRGLGLRNFYPNFGQIFRDDLARGSNPLMHELNAIYGATASQASPETNLQRTLAVMTAGRWFRNTYPELNRPPTVDELAVLTASKPGERLRHNQYVTPEMEGMFSAGGVTTADLAKVVKIWKTGRADIGAGWKTPVFYQNILTSARNLIDRLSVPDTHMFRGRGYTMTGGQAPATVNTDLRALGITNATVTQLADEFGLNPKQVQSALWFDYKENLAPFNATDKARIKAKAQGAEEGTPEWLAAAREHDPWPTTEIRSKPRLDAEGNPILKEDGTPEYETARQGTIASVMQHVAGVNPGKHAKALEDAEYTARGEVTPGKSRGKTRKAYRRFDLLQAFRDQDKAFSERFGQDALTPEAERAALTFNGRNVGTPEQTGGWVGEKSNVQGVTIPYEAQEGVAQRMRRGVPSMEITPEAMERAAFKLGQEAPVVVVPVDAGDGEALSRLGYDGETGQIDVLRQESIPHEVILENRPFTVGAPGEATPRETIHVLFPGASLDTARYGAAILGQRSGADEVAITWPTGEGQGRPVVAIDHPDGGQWTEPEIARFPWAQKLVGRANLSPDGRTFYFADFGADTSGVPFTERVQAILDDAMSADEQQALVHRSADFGAERVGGESFTPLVEQGTLVGGGPLGEAAMARAFPGLEGGTPRNRPYAEWAEGGEAVPGSRPGAVNLREYAGPEGFRAPGAPRGSLGIAAGMGRRGDRLDERLQAAQMVAGGIAGGVQADQYEEEDSGLQRAARITGGALLGATAGANAANPRRLLRAAQAFGREMGGTAAAGRGLRAAGEALGTDGRLGAVAGGPPTGPVPERGKQGEDVGLGDLDDPENLAQQILNPPEGGWQGAQQQELIRAMARRVKNPEVSAPGAKGEQVEAERGRRLERRQEARQEAQDKVARARGPEETGDAAADAEDAARRGEIGKTDADSVRAQAARKLQAQKGDDGPPPPGEMDRQIQQSRARRGVKAPEEAPPGPVEGAAEQTVERVREGLKRLPEQAPPSKAELVGPRAAGLSPEELARREAETPEGTAVLPGEPQPRQLEMGADLAPGRPAPEPLPEQQPPSGRELVGERAPGASLEGEPTAPETAVVQGEPGPEALQLELEGSRTEMAGAARRVGGETEAERLDREAREAPGRAQAQERATAGNVGALQRQFEGTAEQIPVARGAPEPGVARVAEEPGPRRAELPGLERQEGEGALSRVGGETAAERADRLAAEAEARATGLREAGERALPPAERRAPEENQLPFQEVLGPGTSFLLGADGNPLTKQQIADRVAGRMMAPGGWAAVREEWGNLLPDAGKALVAGMRGVALTPGQIDRALRGQRGQGKGRPGWEELSNKQRENLASLRPEHFFDALSTMSRLNLVVNPESILRNVFSTSVGLPFRFFEATTGPIFEGAWAAIPRPRPGADGTVKWSRRGTEPPSDPAEVIAMGEGMVRSFAAALANVAGVMRRGDLAAEARQLDEPRSGGFHETRAGRWMGNAFRPLTAGDAFFKTLNEGMEAYRVGYRQASQEFKAGKLGDDPRAIRTRMIEVMQSPTPKMLSQIQQAGEYNTYNQKAGFLATRLESIKNWDAGGHPGAAAAWRLGMNFLVPFVRISTNVMKYGFERTIPGGALSLAHGALTGKSDYEMGQRTARLGEGALIAAALTSLQQSGAVEIAGALPEDESERSEWELQGKTPFSIRVGDRWYNPGVIPGLAENVVMAGLLGDMERGQADKEARGEEYTGGDRASAAMRATLAYLGQTGVRPMFGSVLNLLNAGMARDPNEQDYYLNQLARSAAGQAAPLSGTFRGIGNVTDPNQREIKTWQDQMAAIYPWWRENLPERTNALGETMPSEGYEFPLAGLTSSRRARDEELPRRYLGSESARQDLQISRAIKAVQDYARDPSSYEPPTGEERALAARFGKRENKARQALDKRVKAAERRAVLERTTDQELGLDEPFRFRAPTGIVEAPMRFEDYMRSYGGAS